jgi:hypothetical protein
MLLQVVFKSKAKIPTQTKNPTGRGLIFEKKVELSTPIIFLSSF